MATNTDDWEEIMTPEEDARFQRIMEGAVEQGDKFIITWGSETIKPADYNSFVVGPFSMEIVPKPGQTVWEAMERAYDTLEAMAEVAYRRRRNQFWKHWRARENEG